jgi:hypothetical protein
MTAHLFTVVATVPARAFPDALQAVDRFRERLRKKGGKVTIWGMQPEAGRGRGRYELIAKVDARTAGEAERRFRAAVSAVEAGGVTFGGLAAAPPEAASWDFAPEGARPAPAAGPAGGTLWLAQVHLDRMGAEARGVGCTPAEAVESLGAAWIAYCERTGDYPARLLADECGDDMEDVELVALDPGRGYVLGGTDAMWHDRKATTDDPDVAAAWERVLERVKADPPAP